MDSIRPLPSIQPVQQHGQREQGSSANRPPLNNGQLLKAVVAQVGEGGTFWLEIGNSRLEATSSAPLKVGDILQLQVLRTTPAIELQIVRDSPLQLIGKTLTLLDSTFDISTLFQSLKGLTPSPLDQLKPVARNLLEHFSQLQQQPLNKQGGGTLLRELITNLGLKMEAMLAAGEKAPPLSTLKAALLELLTHFSKGDAIAEQTNKLLNSLQVFQISQVHLAGDQIIVPLPLLFLEQGFLVYDQPKQQSTDGEEFPQHHFSLFLKLTAIGNLQVNILQTSHDLRIRFVTEDEIQASFLRSHIDQLQDSLSLPASISFATGAQDPRQVLGTTVLPGETSSLDTRI